MAVEDWAEIRRLHRAEGLPIKLIARTLGISRNTVRAALASDGPPKYERKPAGSAVDAFDDAIRAQLTAVPTMPASVIAERVGWTRGMTVFNTRVRELRPAYLPPDPAGRTTYDAGDIAQCDLWFPPTTIPVGYGQSRTPMQLPVLTMVLGYSRWLSAIRIRSQTLLRGWCVRGQVDGWCRAHVRGEQRGDPAQVGVAEHACPFRLTENVLQDQGVHESEARRGR